MEPINTEGLTGEDVDELVTKTREEMLVELKRLSATKIETKKTS